MQKQKKIKSYTAQIKVVSVVDVDIELPEATANFEAALTAAKNLKLEDIYEQQIGVTENDHCITVVGLFGGEDWDVN